MAKLRPIIKKAEQYVEKILAKEGSGHDWYHIERVCRLAVRIAHEEKVNVELVELMALLHELPDRKIVGLGNEQVALKKIDTWLRRHKVTKDDRKHILYVITNQSFSASGLRGEKLPSREGQVMQDADRLEALGAIGIARCFAFGGKTGRLIYNPEQKARQRFRNKKDYFNYHSSSINHFYEKLLKLKDLMNTPTGKKIAHHRHTFMEEFLEEFYDEWNGKR